MNKSWLRLIRVFLLLTLVWSVTPQYVIAQQWTPPLYSTCLVENEGGQCLDWSGTTTPNVSSTLLGYISSVNFPTALTLYTFCYR